MPIKAGALARACGAEADAPLAHELCDAELGRFTEAMAGPDPVLVACTQEAPAFRRAHADAASGTRLDFV